MPTPTRRAKSLSLFATLALMVSAMLPAGVVAKTPVNPRPVAAPSWVTSPTPDLGRLDKSNAAAVAAQATSGQDGNPDYELGDQVVGINLDDTSGSYFLDLYHVVAIGEHIEVWIQDDLSFPTGDPRNPVVITQAQIDYLVDQFDNNIYPKESEFWRVPQVRDGTNALLPYDYVSFDGKDRVIAMIGNVEDENFFDPTFPVYIGGFFSSTINAYLDRNVITIDAYDWANRVGPNDAPWRDADPSNDRPHLYEGTFAHEYQHLLHGDQNPGEESWVNEGLSDWTEWLVGYGIPDGHWDTAQEYAENSLVIWGDQGQATEILADYGEAFMFFHYVYGRYGEEAMHAIFENQGFGIAGVNAALASIGADATFEEVYHDFSIARLVLAKSGKYHIPDIPSPVVLNEEAYSTPGAPPWGSDYLKITNPKKVSGIEFNGVDVLTRSSAWTSVDDPVDDNGQVLYSGGGDEQDHWAIFETTGGGSLTFDTLYDIEESWDYGFVEVSADGGQTWTALANADTRTDIDPDGYPAIKSVLTTGEGFTGYSGGWVNESFDLSSYSGPILVGFRLMTDWGSNGNGELENPNWYVDNVAVNGSVLSDGSNAADLHDITYYVPVPSNFNVDLVSLPREGSIGNSSFKVLHLVTDDATEVASVSQIRQALRNSNLLVLIVTYDAPQGIADYAPYDVEVLR